LQAKSWLTKRTVKSTRYYTGKPSALCTAPLDKHQGQAATLHTVLPAPALRRPQVQVDNGQSRGKSVRGKPLGISGHRFNHTKGCEITMNSKLEKLLLACGTIGPILFVSVFLIEDFTRAEFNPVRNLVSQLSLGDKGWINIINLVLFGVLVILFSFGIKYKSKNSSKDIASPNMFLVLGIALILGGIFVIDPGLGYPPRSEPTFSISGLIHQVAGLIVFVSFTANCFITAKKLGKYSNERRFRILSIVFGIIIPASWIIASTMVSLEYSGTFSPALGGLFERVSLIAACVWVVLLSQKLLKMQSEREENA
jgi:hypothetical membrane protein